MNEEQPQEVHKDMLSCYCMEEESAAEFLRNNEIKILEISREIRGVLVEHFHNKWKR